MVEETTKKAIDEMMILYKQNKIEELKKIRDDVNETSDRKIAAHTVLQLGKDPRRLFSNNNISEKQIKEELFNER